MHAQSFNLSCQPNIPSELFLYKVHSQTYKREHVYREIDTICLFLVFQTVRLLKLVSPLSLSIFKLCIALITLDYEVVAMLDLKVVL